MMVPHTNLMVPHRLCDSDSVNFQVQFQCIEYSNHHHHNHHIPFGWFHSRNYPNLIAVWFMMSAIKRHLVEDDDECSEVKVESSKRVKGSKTASIYDIGSRLIWLYLFYIDRLCTYYWFLLFVFPRTGGKRKVQVSEFKGRLLVNIREYYDDKVTGEEKPGSKGIALSLDQWKMLKDTVSIILVDLHARMSSHCY